MPEIKEEEMSEYGLNEEPMVIIVDAGADASLFPGSMMHKGKQAMGASSPVQDAQGTRIQTYGHKDIDIVLDSSDGRKVVLRERVTFSDGVSQPIISIGRLMKAGWSLDGVGERLRNGQVEVPLMFQNRSLVVKGYIRTVLEANKIRALTVQLGDELTRANEKCTFEAFFMLEKMSAITYITLQYIALHDITLIHACIHAYIHTYIHTYIQKS